MEKKIGGIENEISDVGGLVTIAVLNTKIGEVENKIPHISGLVTTAVCNIKIGEIENKICDVGSLVKKADYDSEISDIKEKYLITADYNKFTSDILDAKIKQKTWSMNLIFPIS